MCNLTFEELNENAEEEEKVGLQKSYTSISATAVEVPSFGLEEHEGRQKGISFFCQESRD